MCVLFLLRSENHLIIQLTVHQLLLFLPLRKPQLLFVYNISYKQQLLN